MRTFILLGVNLIPKAWGWQGKLVKGVAEHMHLQPFPSISKTQSYKMQNSLSCCYSMKQTKVSENSVKVIHSSLPCFINCPSCLITQPSISGPLPEQMLLKLALMLPGNSDSSHAVARSYWLQLCAVLGSSDSRHLNTTVVTFMFPVCTTIFPKNVKIIPFGMHLSCYKWANVYKHAT
jgi:hypothetical protein